MDLQCCGGGARTNHEDSVEAENIPVPQEVPAGGGEEQHDIRQQLRILSLHGRQKR